MKGREPVWATAAAIVANTGRKLPDHVKAALLAANLGSWHSEQHKANIATTMRVVTAGRTPARSVIEASRTLETRANRSAALTGIKRPYRSERLKGVPLPLDVREKIPTTPRGREIPPEQRAKISPGMLKSRYPGWEQAVANGAAEFGDDLGVEDLSDQ